LFNHFARAAAVGNLTVVKIVKIVSNVFIDSPFNANASRRETPSLYNENAPLKTDAGSFSRKNAPSFAVRVAPTQNRRIITTLTRSVNGVSSTNSLFFSTRSLPVFLFGARSNRRNWRPPLFFRATAL
jgi:hypothetical protein